jgi:hypothetical protein
MTNQGTAHGRFQRAIQRRNLFQAELALREMRDPSLARPRRLPRGRLELEAAVLTIAESQLALAALDAMRAGDKTAADVLHRLLRRVQPTRVRTVY